MRNEKGQFIKGYTKTEAMRESSRLNGLRNRGKKRTDDFKRNLSGQRKGVRLGEKAHNWRGGRYVDAGGYVHLLRPNHPFRSKAGYVMEHRLVVEERIGRYLKPDEVIHHLNHVSDDNRSENLVILTASIHNSIASRSRKSASR